VVHRWLARSAAHGRPNRIASAAIRQRHRPSTVPTSSGSAPDASGIGVQPSLLSISIALSRPEGASEGPSVTPSPLAQGPTDPLIRAYFQIDPAGRVTLPTLPDADMDAKASAKSRRNARSRAICRLPPRGSALCRQPAKGPRLSYTRRSHRRRCLDSRMRWRPGFIRTSNPAPIPESTFAEWRISV
jgi:hypothetical protein